MAQELTTERLKLRPFTAADGARVVEMLGDFEVSKWLARVSHPFGAGDLRLLNEDGTSRWPDLMAITLDGEVIGDTGAGPHFGYYIDRAHWGRGYASEAAKAAVNHGFGALNHEAMEAGVFDGNTASRRILDRLGFRESGREMRLCRARNTELPCTILTLTREDWETRV